MADKLTKFAGSWVFIIGFMFFLIIWIALNSYALIFGVWDPFPFILLNLMLSCIAAIQAPIILMSQNREHERENAKAERDYYVNRNAEKEIKVIQKDILELKAIIMKQPLKEETDAINKEIKKIEEEMFKLKNVFN
ncbi:MAG: DUF1003 domain-containing protein [Candidatus Diapherotrites archaeon]|nr:DUF1003 domain-containing protein [Candidatus Diapherotrites archaeon]